jgi:hypothetical protein
MPLVKLGGLGLGHHVADGRAGLWRMVFLHWTFAPTVRLEEPAHVAVPGRGVFALVGPFKFHSISLCGRLDSLPRRTTFRFRNALHLLEARGSVAYVRGIFQQLRERGESTHCGFDFPIRPGTG